VNGIVRALASLRLTVALFTLAMLLIFLGTLAQTRLGVWQAVDQYFRSPVAWVDPAILVPRDAEATPTSLRIPIPGGLTIITLMIVNLLAAHARRARTWRKRPGVLVLHAGLIVLLVGELATGFFADEGLMAIDEGERTSFIEDVRAVELAVIDPSDPEQDRVVTIPGSIVARSARAGKAIDDPSLPFTISVERWMPNALLVRARGETTATHGVGLEAEARERPRVAGVEGSEADQPAAYLTLSRDGQTLGTWLVSAALVAPQPVDAGETTFGLALRFARTYLPYAVHLDDFRHDVFTGTTIPRNFSSDVRIVDAAGRVDREVRIWMNHPLRYAGRTFYQSSYKPDGSGTVLQVVRNPAWTLPYIACALVALGMGYHFVVGLATFLSRRREREGRANVAPAPRSPRAWPWILGAAAMLLALAPALRPPPASELDLRAFSQIPVSSGGRLKPIDTAARSMLMIAGGRQTAEHPDRGELAASEYLLDLIARPDRVRHVPVVRVDHPDALALLDLAPEDAGRVSLARIEPHWDRVIHQARAAANAPDAQRDAFHRAVLTLHDRVNVVLAHAQMREPYLVPPTSPDGQWAPFRDAFLDARDDEHPHPSVAYTVAMMTAAADGDAEGFHGAARDYLELLNRSMPSVVRKAQLETVFNRAAPFNGALAIYLLAFLGALASFVARAGAAGERWGERLRVGALVLLVAAVVLHTAALAVRVYLQERPPVTNLYSSAIFVGWAAALAGIFMERLFPLGVATLGSAAIGAATLVVAINLGGSGDTMQMMQAVLDSNFWLATHVITITLGYSATFLAGAIASVYLLARLLTRSIDRARDQTFARMIYGVVCFALLLSFVGTVLGGIWADQSWGRFWGWDPKENGAALVVLMSAIILHARWGGLIRTRGIAALAVAGNIVTAWSWFGTNMLGVGLHAYGFMDSASLWLAIFVASQLAIIGSAAAIPPLPPRRVSDR